MTGRVGLEIILLCTGRPGRVAQLVGHLTRKSEVLGSIPGLATYFRFSFRWVRGAVVSYWRMYVHEVLVNRLGGLSLPRKSVVRLTDRSDMTLDVYRGRKTTTQPTNQLYRESWFRITSNFAEMLYNRKHSVWSRSTLYATELENQTVQF